MANWSNPTLTSLYTDFVTEVKNRDVDLALGLDPATTSPTNVPTNAIRWNSASFKYQKWDGTTWNDLSTKYIFTAVEVSGSTVPVNGMYLSTTNTLNFSTASTASRLTIDGSGNVSIDSGTFYVDAVNNRVGVGTTDPQARLGVAGDTNTVLRIDGSATSAITFAEANTNKQQIYMDAGNLVFYDLANAAERLRLDASGNLGLGVVPSTWDTTGKVLQFEAGAVYSYSTTSIAVFQNATYSDTFRYVNTAAASRYTQTSGQHQWYTSTNTPSAGAAITFTQAMTLDASGNLGVGATSPTARLHLATSSSSGTSNADGIRINSGGNVAINIGSNSSIGYGWIQSANWGSGYIPTVINPNGGNVGIGTTSPDVNLVVSNGGTASSASGGTLARLVGSGVSRLDIVGGNSSYSILEFSRANLTAAAQVAYEHSTNSLYFTTNGTTERARIDSSGRLLVGTSSARNKFFNTTYTPQLQLEGVGQQQSMFSLTNSIADNGGPVLALAKQRSGTIGGTTIVNNGDTVGQIDFFGSDGAEMVALAEISAAVDGAPGADDMPGRLVFSTTADGAAAPAERMRINNLGYMQGTVNGLGAGRIPAKQYYRLDSAFTGTNGTAAQPIYGVGVTLIGSTVYEFEAIYAFSRSTGSTSHTMSFLFGGTATINNIFYTGVGPGDGILPPLSTYDGGPASFVATSAGASVATAAMTIGTGIFYIVKGTVSINAGGTFIPQYQLSAAPGGAYSTYAGAYFSIWPLAASGAAVNIGSWA